MGAGLMNDITYVGLDVHKATVCVAIAESGRGGEVERLAHSRTAPTPGAKRPTAWQAAASPQLLLRGRALRIWTLPFADRPGARRASWWHHR